TSAARARATARQADTRAKSLFTTTNTIPGVGMILSPEGVAALAGESNVVKISRLPRYEVTNANAAQLVNAINTWRYRGNIGSGVRVGVIDTGIDYTHADFGGPGTIEAYDAAIAKAESYNWRAGLGPLGKAKVLGGYDFVGDDYNADPSAENYQPIPNPDTNPIDCGEHGTHVSGTVGGYGVDADGATFTGDYSKLKPARLSAMDVGPGMAPGAQLYGLKVFGCEGSTDIVIDALDWALDPNGDGAFDDHLDIVNLSLGSDYAPGDDPQNAVTDKLAEHGVLAVFSAGNNGDLTDTGGSDATSSISVASSVDSLQQRDGLIVNAPGDVAGTVGGQVSVAYDWLANGPTGASVSGVVATIPGDNSDGCDPLSDADAALVAGKVAWLEWDDSDATRRCGSVGRSGNVKAAGAIGSIFTSSLDVFGAGITGDEEIPVFQLPKAGTDQLRAAAEAGELEVTFDGALVGTIKDVTPAITDTLSSFSSRGLHGSVGVVKPDVAAVGDTVSSALMGSGNKVLTISGTSMAAPTTAGVAALVQGAHPTWGPLMLKSAVVNNARHDVFTGPGKTGERYGPARVGAGRIDAIGAVRGSVLAYADGPGVNPVSASFGVVPAPVAGGPISKTINVTVRNTSAQPVKVKLAYEAINPSPGVTYTVTPGTVKLGKKASTTATVTMRVVPSELRHRIDPTMDVEQVNPYFGEAEPRQFVSDSSGRMLVTPQGKPSLRVPVYGAAKPTSAMSAALVGDALALTGADLATGDGPTDYNSLVSVLELGETSDRLPTCDQVEGGEDGEAPCTTGPTDEGGDLSHVGASSTTGENALLTFGIATFGEWANIGNVVIPYVDYDVTGDGEADFETYVQTIAGTDLLYAWTIDLNVDPADSLVDLEPVNLQFGDVDTNVFDTNVLTMSVLKEAIGMTTEATSTPIEYTVGMFSAITGDDIDTSGPVAYDAGTPVISTESTLLGDIAGDSVALTGTRSVAAKALVLHLHNAPGTRAQVVDVPAK
ncbi:MAG: S8 family serine peptidase, partial [Nocardioides sp.]